RKTNVRSNSLAHRTTWLRSDLRESALGLKSMKERIQLMRGSFQIKTELKKGTKIEIQLPV
ncbi:hypothetical protein PTB13_15685, partial [Bacillus sp. MHSD17]|nr:hypothetical protein [Bacillus sp. MHSD17]